jgi:hypothetical protein
MSDTLFDPGPGVPPSEVEPLSYQRRVTLRHKADLARGIHPVSKLALRAEGGTCGDCAHHVVVRHSNTYHGCSFHRGCGPATDIRVSWPACTAFVAEMEGAE